MIEDVKEQAARHGRTIKTIINPHMLCRDSEAEARAVRQAIIDQGDPVAAQNFLHSLVGGGSQSWRRRTLDEIYVGGNLQVVGTPEQVVEQIVNLHCVGCDGIQVNFFDYLPDIGRFAEKILQHRSRAAAGPDVVQYASCARQRVCARQSTPRQRDYRRAAACAFAIARRGSDRLAATSPRWDAGTTCLDSAYDYDPVWAKCVELGVPPTFHSAGMGWGSRASISNSMYNHIGHFTSAGEALCKALFFGGVTRRFPTLRFGFLECGVGWACSLFADMIGHWEKRNGKAMENYNPANLNLERLIDLYQGYGGKMVEGKLEQLRQGAGGGMLAGTKEDPATVDDWWRCGIEKPEDIKELFVPSFYFGCEADDPMNASAFNTTVNPFGAELNAVFSSDIGHWDVPDMTEVTEEAYVLVEEGKLTEDNFRDFVFVNPACWYQTEYYYYSQSADDPQREIITTLPIKSMVTSPKDNNPTLPRGRHVLRGFAWSGAGMITRVEVSVDDGKTWHVAHLEEPREKWLWARWSLPWDFQEPGQYAILCRATDEAGRVQSREARWNQLRKNFNGIVPVQVTIA